MKELRSYYDFRGGLNTDAAPDNMLDNELVQADNVILVQRGGLTKRLGTVAINSTSYNAQVEQLVEFPRNNGTVELLAIIGTNLSRVDRTNGAATTLAAVNSRRIGRFFLNDKFYFVDGTDYRVYDGSTVTSVTPNAASDNNLAPIKRCKYLVRHPNSYRIFAAGDPQNPSAVYFSEINDPTYFKSSSVLLPTTDDGQVVGLVPFGDAVVVLYAHSIWAWRGTDPATDATWKKVPTGVGAYSDACVALTPNSLGFLGPGGFYVVNPAIIGYDVTILPDEGLVRDITENKVGTLIKSITLPDRAVAVYDSQHQRLMLAYTDDPNGVRNTFILVYDWTIGAFTRYTNLPMNDLIRTLDGDILGATNGYIVRFGEGYRDYDGSAITMSIKTKEYNLDQPFRPKRITRLYTTYLQPVSGDLQITTKVLVDNVSQFQAAGVDASTNFKWGDPWKGVWGWNDLITTREKISQTGQRVQIEFTNDQLDMPATVYGFAFEFRVLNAKGTKI